MLWGAILLGVLGVLIGLRYRAPALVPATLLAITAGIVGGWWGGQAAGHVAASSVVMALTLNVAYLAGLALRTLVGR